MKKQQTNKTSYSTSVNISLIKVNWHFQPAAKAPSTTSTLLLTNVWRHYRLISALADCISIHWRVRLNKHSSQNIIVGCISGSRTACLSLEPSQSIAASCCTELRAKAAHGGAVVKENNPIPYIFTTEEYSKRLSFFFLLLLMAAFHLRAAGTKKSSF